ncbi:MAG: hypothetical protein RIF33_11190 [Cyclobacteriaceae bacterium]
MKVSKQGVGKIAVEFISVVFAVLLALGLNHWRENKINEQLAADSYQRIQREVQDNIAELDSSLIEFDRFIEEIKAEQSLLDSLGDNYKEVSWSYSHPVLSIDAWKAATITNAVLNMDPDLVEDLADVYAVQEMYMEFGFKFFDRAAEMARFRDDPETMIEIIQTHYAISKSIAKSLREGYGDFLEEYPLAESE